MRRRNMPVTNLGGFVVVKIEVRAQLNFIQSVQIKPEIDWRVVSRIAPHDDERFDFARVNVGNKFAQRLSLIDWVGFNGISVEDCLADVTECVVHEMCHPMENWRLIITNNDYAGSVVLCDIS